MRLEWIDDILAVLDCGSLAQAAEKRMLTQSAFTRRVRTIEQSIGTTLFDRRRKPVSLMPGVKVLEPDLREASARLHSLRHALGSASSTSGKSLTFVCQHALTSTISPQVVRAATRNGETSVRVRSGNQDECLMQLLSQQVDLAIMYAVPDGTTPEISSAFDSVGLGSDLFVPVCAPRVRNGLVPSAIPVIAYPADVFLGQVITRMITPRLPQGSTLIPVAETALTLAMLELAVNEIGIAWLPMSLVQKHLAKGDLVRVDDLLPAQTLNVQMVRTRAKQSAQIDAIWQHLARQLHVGSAAPSQDQNLAMKLTNTPSSS